MLKGVWLQSNDLCDLGYLLKMWNLVNSYQKYDSSQYEIKVMLGLGRQGAIVPFATSGSATPFSENIPVVCFVRLKIESHKMLYYSVSILLKRISFQRLL